MNLHADVALVVEQSTKELQEVLITLMDDPDFRKLIQKKKQKAERKKQEESERALSQPQVAQAQVP
jgi:hypothetical protein